ncbi:hypothetical protein LENED_000789 [Lentinula edodes]|uniref:Uncharacterized protein n=1 Tax=Lentinula edodes TaxID=5353 RepID=A0A1Q3DX78_LENED|nr:hypothetical protein LENED_000789 [Lentinula edodes]
MWSSGRLQSCEHSLEVMTVFPDVRSTIFRPSNLHPKAFFLMTQRRRARGSERVITDDPFTEVLGEYPEAVVCGTVDCTFQKRDHY